MIETLFSQFFAQFMVAFLDSLYAELLTTVGLSGGGVDPALLAGLGM